MTRTNKIKGFLIVLLLFYSFDVYPLAGFINPKGLIPLPESAGSLWITMRQDTWNPSVTGSEFSARETLSRLGGTERGIYSPDRPGIPWSGKNSSVNNRRNFSITIKTLGVEIESGSTQRNYLFLNAGPSFSNPRYRDLKESSSTHYEGLLWNTGILEVNIGRMSEKQTLHSTPEIGNSFIAQHHLRSQVSGIRKGFTLRPGGGDGDTFFGLHYSFQTAHMSGNLHNSSLTFDANNAYAGYAFAKRKVSFRSQEYGFRLLMRRKENSWTVNIVLGFREDVYKSRNPAYLELSSNSVPEQTNLILNQMIQGTTYKEKRRGPFLSLGIYWAF